MARTLAAIHATDTADRGIAHLRRPPPDLGVWPPGQRSSLGRRRDSVRARQLLHGDFWPGNLLWHDGGPAVLDWRTRPSAIRSRTLRARAWNFPHGGAAVAARFTDVYLQ
jgi:hypothetical protein